MFIRVDPIEKMIELLREHYLLLYHEKHSLQFTVLEQMDALTYLLSMAKEKSLLPCVKLEKNFPLFVDVVNRRAQ
jgi:hypothetical protein